MIRQMIFLAALLITSTSFALSKEYSGHKTFMKLKNVNIEDILNANRGKSVGSIELLPEYKCEISVESFNNENVMYEVFAGIAETFFPMAYPLDRWNLDEKANTLRCILNENTKSVMNIEFDSSSFKFKKFYRTLDGKKTSACILE